MTVRPCSDACWHVGQKGHQDVTISPKKSKMVQITDLTLHIFYEDLTKAKTLKIALVGEISITEGNKMDYMANVLEMK